MTTLDTLALPNTFCWQPMLRDPPQWINTTSFGHGKLSPYQQRVRALRSPELLRPSMPCCYITRSLYFHDVGDTFPLPPATYGTAASGQHLPAVEENATNDRQRRDQVCLVMAVNDGGVPPILAQKQYSQPAPFSPGKLLAQTPREK